MGDVISSEISAALFLLLIKGLPMQAFLVVLARLQATVSEALQKLGKAPLDTGTPA